jgi:hypothetical protein
MPTKVGFLQSCGLKTGWWYSEPEFVALFQVGWVAHDDDERDTARICAFNTRALLRDLEEMCRKVNAGRVTLPDGRRLVVTVGQQRSGRLNGPLASTG